MTEYTEIKKEKEPTVYLLQEIPGTSVGRPKFNIMGALKFGDTYIVTKIPNRFGWIPPAPDTGNRRHARIIPTRNIIILNEETHIPLTQHRVGEL